MAVWSEIYFSEALRHDRFSGEYWQPEYTEPLSRKLPWIPLGDVLVKVQYGISREMNEAGIGVPCYRMNEMDGPFVSSPAKCMLITNEEKKQFFLRRGDVLFNRTNSLKFVGRTGLCLNDSDSVFASYLIRLRTDKTRLLPEYLSMYLNTSVGIGQVKRRAMESINQANVSGSEVRLVPIPLFGLSFQQIVADLMQAAARFRNTAIDALIEAETVLSAALGLDRVDLTPRLFYEDTFAHAADAARLDAEYFNPRMQSLIKTLSAGGKTIGDVAPLANRRFKTVPGKPFDYIEIGDIGAAGTAGSNTVPGEEAPSRATWIVKPGDIITTTVRPIRRLSAIILPEQDGFVCSSGFAVLRPRDVEPELLLTYLRLPLVAELLDLNTTASMYPAISTADLLRIPFRLPNAQARAKIVGKVRESFTDRAESLRLLDEAKHTVEAAIIHHETW